MFELVVGYFVFVEDGVDVGVFEVEECLCVEGDGDVVVGEEECYCFVVDWVVFDELFVDGGEVVVDFVVVVVCFVDVGVVGDLLFWEDMIVDDEDVGDDDGGDCICGEVDEELWWE